MGYKMLRTNIRKILTNWGKLVTWALWIRRKTALPVSMLTKSLSRPLLKGGRRQMNIHLFGDGERASLVIRVLWGSPGSTSKASVMGTSQHPLCHSSCFYCCRAERFSQAPGIWGICSEPWLAGGLWRAAALWLTTCVSVTWSKGGERVQLPIEGNLHGISVRIWVQLNETRSKFHCSSNVIEVHFFLHESLSLEKTLRTQFPSILFISHLLGVPSSILSKNASLSAYQTGRRRKKKRRKGKCIPPGSGTQ